MKIDFIVCNAVVSVIAAVVDIVIFYSQLWYLQIGYAIDFERMKTNSIRTRRTRFSWRSQLQCDVNNKLSAAKMTRKEKQNKQML